jgi:two-component system chemotaxis sensor kinase CheA
VNVNDALLQLIEEASEQVVLLDIKDLPCLAKFCKHLQSIGSAFAAIQSGEPVNAIAGEAANKAASLVEGIIFESSHDPVADMKVAASCVSALQAIGHGRKMKEAGFPVELGLSTPDELAGGAAPTGQVAVEQSSPAPESKSVVDDDLLAAYVDQQISALSDMETAILTFEQNYDPESMAMLRRILHTMKGDAGVMGFGDIGSFCHAAEDCIGGDVSGISVDALLDIKDWLDKAVKAYAGDKKPQSPPDILSKRTKAPGSEASVAADTGPVKPPAVNESDAGRVTSLGEESPGQVTLPTETEDVAKDANSVSISDRDLARDFVGEAQEHFDMADENLLILEHDPANVDAVGAVFRAFHTIKGVSGFLGLKPVGELAHVAETLFDEVRKGKRQFVGVVVEVTFNALDMLKIMIGDLKDALMAGADMKVRSELPALIATLKNVLEGATPSTSQGQSSSPGAGKEEMLELNTAAKDCRPPMDDKTAEIDCAKDERDGGRQSFAAAADTTAKSATREGVEVAQTMKVDAEKIDLLLDTIGELVIAESIVASDPDIQALKSLRLEKNMTLLGKITRSLQDMGMAMRLVPIDATFRKMSRLVRDLSKKSGKQVELVMEGGETEIDKGMVEKLGDPLIHMIRNSMDHGIESVEERKAKGKNPVGHVTLRAHHKGGSIHIDIEDDGKGLDREAIVAKAIEKGLLKTGDGVSDQEVFALIFAAGFSTAKQITEISGRGVGMDVVRRNIESLRGNVVIQTRPGEGTTFTIVLPLTMAIIDGMLAKVSSEVYVLPTLSIIESFRPTPKMITTVTGKGEMVAFRGALLPLFRISRVFRVSGAIENPCEAIVMVVEDGGKRWGLLVDNILGQQQIVIKSLGDSMGHVAGIAGASIMADGRPGLILDIAGVVKLALE